MRYQNKLQFFFLILAFAIFCGRELVHPVFHAHQKINSYYSQCQSDNSEELKTADNFTRDAFFKYICPICNSAANKATLALGVQEKLVNYNSLTCAQLCESFSFPSCDKPVSRGPPTA